MDLGYRMVDTDCFFQSLLNSRRLSNRIPHTSDQTMMMMHTIRAMDHRLIKGNVRTQEDSDFRRGEGKSRCDASEVLYCWRKIGIGSESQLL